MNQQIQNNGFSIPPFNENTFKQLLARVDKAMLEQLKQTARNIGIPESVINEGLEKVSNLKA